MKQDIFEENYVWNPSICVCECKKKLKLIKVLTNNCTFIKHVVDNLLITYEDDIVYTKISISSVIPTCTTTKNLYYLFLLMLLSPIIIIIIYKCCILTRLIFLKV